MSDLEDDSLSSGSDKPKPNQSFQQTEADGTCENIEKTRLTRIIIACLR